MVSRGEMNFGWEKKYDLEKLNKKVYILKARQTRFLDAFSSVRKTKGYWREEL